MTTDFKSSLQREMYSSVISGLRSLGYDDSLLVENYKFGDWFVRDVPEREIRAAAFGQTPLSTYSACFGVALSNGVEREDLVTQFRALGAPLIFEVGDSTVRQWAIGPEKRKASKLGEFALNDIPESFVLNAKNWTPASFLRAKNIGDFKWSRQLNLFAGLLPELEYQVQEQLNPFLRSTLSAAVKDYRERENKDPDPEKMFQLVFWMLTGKVFHDRDIKGFRSSAIELNADAILGAVAKHYRTTPPRLLTKATRDIVFSRIWEGRMDFRNLSVDVLANTWSKALVSNEVRSRLGIHKTSRTLATYLVDRIPFEGGSNNRQTVLEPCCGSAVFLIAAMQKLRTKLFGLSSKDRHEYFTRHLVGLETDPFGVEISWLSLTLADFPNPNGWQIHQTDVFRDDEFLRSQLSIASVVLCNPPFEDFNSEERSKYGVTSVKKPVELLFRVLEHLHPSGVIGFVLPRNVVDGRGYSEVRRQMAKRFASIEVTILPDKAFEADHEVAIVIGTNPVPHSAVALSCRRVRDNASDWSAFELQHVVSSEYSTQVSIEQASESLAIPELQDAWTSLKHNDVLSTVCRGIHRGIEWNLPLTIKKNGRRVETGNREKLVIQHAAPGFKLGVPPGTALRCLEIPKLAYLDMRPKHQDTSAWQAPWELPKVFLNAGTKSRMGWRIAAFADQKGLVGYQNITAVWPRSIDVVVLAAVLIGPVANAFVATREGKRHVTIETIAKLPIPQISNESEKRIRLLVTEYQKKAALLSESAIISDADLEHQKDLLLQIDASVLEAYDLSPRIERQLLDFFNSDDEVAQTRPVPFDFSNYFPRDFRPLISLSRYISPEFHRATVGEFIRDFESPPPAVGAAIRKASELFRS